MPRLIASYLTILTFVYRAKLFRSEINLEIHPSIVASGRKHLWDSQDWWRGFSQWEQLATKPEQFPDHGQYAILSLVFGFRLM